MNEIAQYANIPVTSLPQYMNSLDEVNFIKREVSITERITSKKGHYILTDYFLRFYFRFIYPNLESLDRKILDIKDIREPYSHYMGSIFEDIVLQFMTHFRANLGEIEGFKNLIREDFFEFTRIGRWWWKGVEIDLVAFNPRSDKAILIECKWQQAVKGSAVAKKLLLKEEKVRYRGEFKKKEHLLMVFAKSFKNREKKVEQFGNTSICYLDLDDMATIIARNQP